MKKDILKMNPLTPMQSGMLYHSLLNQESMNYYQQMCFYLEGSIKVPELKEAWQKVIDRHEIFRTNFIWKGVKTPIQVVLAHKTAQITEEDLSGWSDKEQEACIEQWKAADLRKPLIFEKGELNRLALLRLSTDQYLIVWTFHHILLDGWSGAIVLNEFFQFYQALSKGLTLPDLPDTQFSDYLDWLKKRNPAQGLAFWTECLQNFTEPTLLPADRNGDRTQVITEVAVHEIRLPREQTTVIREFCQTREVTINALIQTAWGILLQKYNNTTQSLSGMTVSGRPADLRNVEQMVGLFINTVPVPIQTHAGDQCSDLLSRVNELLIQARNHEYVSLAEIQSKIRMEPLFDSLIVFENYPLDSAEPMPDSDFRVRFHSIFELTSYDLCIEVASMDELQFRLAYNPDRFARASVEGWGQHFTKIMEQIVAQPAVLVKELQLVTDAERDYLLTVLNQTCAPYPCDLVIHQLFAEQAERTPEKIALVFGEQMVTYRELNQRANQLAWLLRTRGLEADQVVGIMVERSVEMIVGVMGIIKAGGAILPIDPHYPSERIEFMLADSDPRFLLIQQHLQDSVQYGCERIELDRGTDGEQQVLDDLPNITEPHHLLYVIYTSGSTGKPKGVMIEHRNLVNLLSFQYRETQIPFAQKVLQYNTLSFDVAFQEIFSTLLAGGELHLITQEQKENLAALFQVIEQKEITVLFLPAVLVKFVFQNEEVSQTFPRSVEHIITAGEQLLVSSKLRQYLQANKVYLHNHYGPSETHVVTTLTLDPAEEIPDLPPIGAPVANTQIYILDQAGYLQPPGIPGELYIGGEAVGRGYYGKPDLTRERFMPDPFRAGGRMYRTSDLARWLPDGTLAFLGRADHQVKIRGFRIEPGEIETHLLNHPSIQAAAIMDRMDERSERYLVAYFTADQELSASEIQMYLAEQLPAYMIPTYFIQLPQLPLTPSGKMDRRALPEPEKTLQNGSKGRVPETELEIAMAHIWAEILGVKQIGMEDDFFALGGHSLKATQLVSRIFKEMNREVPLREIFAHSTLQSLVNWLSGSEKGTYKAIEPVKAQESYPVSSAQKRVYLIQQMEGEGVTYNIPAAVYIDGELDEARLSSVFQELVRRHEAFRTRFVEMEGEVVQCVEREVELTIEHFRITETSSVSHTTHDRRDNRSAAAQATGSLRTAHDSQDDRSTTAQRTGSLRIAHDSQDDCSATAQATGSLRTVHDSQDVHPAKADCNDDLPCMEQQLPAILQQFIRPFDLTKAPLLRVGLFQISPVRRLLLLDLHHLIADGTSLAIFFREFAALYQGQALPELRIQYKDFAVWQNQFLASREIKAQEEYWLKMFAGELPVLELPTDHPRPAEMSFEGRLYTDALPAELSSRVQELARAEGVTLFMLLLAGFNILLARYTGAKDIVIGTPVAGRRHADLQQMIGMFVNTLAMRNTLRPEHSFREFLAGVKEHALEAFENQDYQFERLVEQLHLERDLRRNALFDVMFALQNANDREIEITGLQMTPCEFDLHIAKFDITLNAFEREGRIHLGFEYNTRLFEPETIARMSGHLAQVLTAVVIDPLQPIKEIEILTDDEKWYLLEEWNRTEQAYPRNMTLAQIFEEQVMNRPDQVALVFGECCMSYGELNARANRLAWYLRQQGVKPDQIVGLKTERSLEMIIGIMGILKSGGAYLPLDPEHPEGRIRYMVEDCEVKILLTRQKIAEICFPEAEGEVYQEEYEASHGGMVWTANPPLINTPADLAYVMYTSGTTGKPKGNLTMHYNICRVVKNTNYIEFQPDDRVLQLSNYAFDGSTFDIFGALLNGATLVLIDQATLYDLDRLAQVIVEERVTVFFITAALFNLLVDTRLECLATVRKIIPGGDRLSVPHVRKAFSLLGPGRIVNGYGPTESTVFATTYTVQHLPPDTMTIPIGRPIANTRVYILNEENHLQPVGVPGELCIAGDGLARGYLKQSELTAVKFVPDPFVTGEYIYRTGDLVKWLPDGNIEFLGRIDHQVKLRGFRIELAEIENLLLAQPEIEEVVVLDRTDARGGKYLCAYLVPAKKGVGNQSGECAPFATDCADIVKGVRQIDRSTDEQADCTQQVNHSISVSVLRTSLAKELPDFMIPAAFIFLAKLPLTANGKVDRKALLEMEPQFTQGRQHVPPATETEIRLAQIWSTLLDVEKVGVDDNFFELGGHSLKVTQLSARILQEFQMSIPLKQIFKTPTIRQLAVLLENGQPVQDTRIPVYSGKYPGLPENHYPVSAAQKRMYMQKELEGDTTTYNMPIAMLVSGPLDRFRLEEALQRVIARHDSLRTAFVFYQGQVVQHVHPAVEFQLEYRVEEAQLEKLVQGFIRPFDLSKAPLLRALLVKRQDNHLLLIDQHHSISDGTSMGIFFHEIFQFYAGHTLPELTLQYKDFAIWQNAFFGSAEFAEQQAYWLENFCGEIPVLHLPADKPRPVERSYEGRLHQFILTEELSAELRALALQEDVTLFMLFLAVFHLLLTEASSQEEIVVGSPIAGRRHTDVDGLIGMFVNTLALKNTLSFGQTVCEFLASVKENVLRAFENQDYPFEALVDQLHRKRDLSRNPLFDVMFVVQNLAKPVVEVGDLTFTTCQPAEITAKFDLLLQAYEASSQIGFSLEYCSALYTAETIEHLADRFQQILDQMVQNPHQLVSQIIRRQSANCVYQESATEEYRPNLTETCFGEGQHDRSQKGNRDRSVPPCSVAPPTEFEARLAQIWSEVLDVQSVGIDDNFFELGGHSLKAMQLIARVDKELNHKISMKQLFAAQTIREVTRLLDPGEVPYKAMIPVSQNPNLPPGYYPASSAQRRLYALKELEGTGTAYNMPMVMLLEGEVDYNQLTAALQALVQRHDSLRTSFTMLDGEIMQVVQPDLVLELSRLELSGEAGEEPGELEIQKVIQEFIRPFDLHCAPLLRAALVKLPGKHVFLLDLHHIIADGASLNIFFKELFGLYAGRSLAPLQLQYKDFAAWQTGCFARGEMLEQEAFWREQLAGDLPLLNLPADRPRPAVKTFEGQVLNSRIGAGLTQQLNTLAAENGVTLYMTLLAVINVLLSRYSGQEDLIIGSPIAGRHHADVEPLIGLFINTLVLRNQPVASQSFRTFLANVKENALKAYENQDYPFELLVEQFHSGRDLSRNPLFDVMFALQTTTDDLQQSIEGFRLQPYPYELQIAKFDLTINAFTFREELFFNFEYSTQLFDRTTIERMAQHLQNLLRAVIKDADQSLYQLEMLGTEERNQVLYQFNDTDTDYPEKTLQQLFEEQVERTPDIPAVCCKGQILTYSQLNTRVNQLAYHLRTAGVGPEQIVGIMAERSLEMVIGILGILKAGGAYLPVDPAYPHERIEFMLKDSGVKQLLTQNHLLAQVQQVVESLGQGYGGKEQIVIDCIAVHDIDTDFSDDAHPVMDNVNLSHIAEPNHLAYVIYTSGSTGEPKGVMIEQRGIVNTITWRMRKHHLSTKDRVLNLFSYAFDGFLVGFFTPLCSGAELIILSEEEFHEPVKIAETIRTQQVTHLHSVPSLCLALLEVFTVEDVAGLQTLALGGEAIKPVLIQRVHALNPEINIVNEYGPTEVSVLTATAHHLEQADRVTIGTPLANTQVYILDRHRALLPVGVVGEVYISGAGLARGYLNQSDLTAAKFVENPFKPGCRMYQSGDLARWLPDGRIEYWGRLDAQVKIRGFRIEPGEIETHLLRQSGVKEAVVLECTDPEGNSCLTAYVVGEQPMSELRSHLAQNLPAYMIPAQFICLQHIPLTPNGKIDRRALSRLESREQSVATYTSPRNETEAQMAVLWSELLGHARVGIDDNLFELGANSLKVVAFVGKVRNTLGIHIPVTQVLQTPTIRHLAESTSRDGTTVWLKQVSSAAPNLFLIHDGSGGITGYLEFVNQLQLKINCWGVSFDRGTAQAPFVCTIQQLAADYIDKIRKIQPHGPYAIAGWSLGGTLAFEIASQLEQSGESVNPVVLFDTLPPNQEPAEAVTFTHETERSWLKRLLPDQTIPVELSQAPDIEELWGKLLTILEDLELDLVGLKQSLAGKVKNLIPELEDLSITELLIRLNGIRTLVNAQTTYQPERILEAQVYFIAASATGINTMRWEGYCRRPLEVYSVEGTHAGIFQQPSVMVVSDVFHDIWQRTRI